MCGIAGFINRGPRAGDDPEASSRLNRMLNTIAHRGPDDWGMYFSCTHPESIEPHEKVEAVPGRGCVALGHRRLSILDLSPNGRQPMRLRSDSTMLLLNGEIYNYIELREELAKEVEFHTGTDTEVVLQAYRKWGRGLLERLDGMFAIVLFDPVKGKILCARDPLAIKPFYYAITEDRFLFGSEPKAVLAGLGTKGTVDPAYLGDFLVTGATDHGEGTCFREIRQLLGGQAIELDVEGNIAEPSFFWKAPTDEVDYGAETPERLRAQFEQAVRFQLRADVPIGSCLSGGTDSSSVVCSVAKLLRGESSHFNVLTLHNENFVGDELEAARTVADHAGVELVPVGTSESDLPHDLEHVVRAQGEPFSTLSILGQHRIMKMARERGLKVMLDGQGGDEVFLGYPRVASRIVKQHLLRGRPLAAVRELLGFQRHANQSIKTTLLTNLLMTSPALARARASARLEGLVRKDIVQSAQESTFQEAFAHQQMKSLQIAELTRTTLPRLLRYEDRNSMWFSIEARVPVLAIPLVEMGLRLPTHWKVRDGWTKYALRKAMADRVPESILWNTQKRGFEVPQARWVEALRPTLGEWLCDLPESSPINPREVLKRLDAGNAGAPYLWRCVSAGLWLREFEVAY